MKLSTLSEEFLFGTDFEYRTLSNCTKLLLRHWIFYGTKLLLLMLREKEKEKKLFCSTFRHFEDWFQMDLECVTSESKFSRRGRRCGGPCPFRVMSVKFPRCEHERVLTFYRFWVRQRQTAFQFSLAPPHPYTNVESVSGRRNEGELSRRRWRRRLFSREVTSSKHFL